MLFSTRAPVSYLDFATGGTISCCSAANPPASPTKSPPRPTRGWRSRSEPGLRSLNVAMAVAMAFGEALRQTDRPVAGEPVPGDGVSYAVKEIFLTLQGEGRARRPRGGVLPF